MAEAPSDSVGDNLDRLLQAAVQQLRDKCFGPPSAQEFLKSLWAACELDTGPPSSGNPAEAHFLQTAYDLVVTLFFEAARQGEIVFAPEQVVFFLICVLASFPTTLQYSEHSDGRGEFRCQQHAILLQVTREMLPVPLLSDDWRDINEVLETVRQLMRMMETKRPAAVLYISDGVFAILNGAHRLRELIVPDFRTRANTWDGHLLYWFGMLQITSLIQLGFLDMANRQFNTVVPTFVGSQMPDDLKAVYNYSRARLYQHSGQYDQALQSAQLALGLIQEEDTDWQEVSELIQTLTEARDTAQRTVDHGWLQDTNAGQTQRQANKQRQIQEQHKAKGKHRRPKRAALTDNATPCLDNKPAHVPTPNTVRVSHSRGIADTVLSTSPASTSVSTQGPLLPSVWGQANNNSTRSNPTGSATCESEDESSEEDHGDATGATSTVNYFQDNQDSNDNSEDFVEKVVTLLPEDGENSWYDYSANRSYPEEENIYISEDELRKYEKPSKKPPFYPELKTDPQEVQQMLKTEPEKYKHCQLISIAAHEAKAKVLDSSSSLSHIWIYGRSKIGRTFLEEEVVVELLAQPQQGGGQAHSTATMVSADRLAYGQVVASLALTRYSDTRHPVFLCTVDDWDFRLMLPFCKTVPKISVLQESTLRSEGRAEKRIDVFDITEDGFFRYKQSFKLRHDTTNQYVFRVVFVTWRYSRSVYPLGVVTAVHRTGRDYTAGLELLAVQHRLPSVYPAEVLQQADQLTADKNLRYDSSREDLTARGALTIDPPGSRDLDDALSLWKEGHHFIVGVHITDVAAVVLPGSPIDEEARRRSFSFYPPHNKCHNMLPEPLSEGQCSLLEGRSCLCLSVFFKLNEKGKQVDDPWVKKTVIKSRWQLTYAKAQTILEKGQCMDTDNELRQSIFQLHRFATLMREARLKTSRFFIPFEDSRLRQRGVTAKNTDAHLLVEEWMLAANAFIGTRLSGKFPSLMITRCQSPPPPQDVQEWLEKEGYAAYLPMGLQDKKVTANKVLSLQTMPSPHPQQLVELQTDVWRRLRDHLEAGEVEEARRKVFTDAVHPLQCLAHTDWYDLMSQAEYRCTYGLNGSGRSHFSLDKDFYTNFTSPLRRYVDLHVQRLLHHDLDGTQPDCRPEEVIELCQHINTVNLRQKSFDKGCRDLDVASRVQAEPLVFRAFLDSVDKDQLVLRLPSLLHTSARSQEIAFASLGVSRQPEIIVDTMLKKTKATVQWNKRIYDKMGTCPGSLKQVWAHLDRTRSVDMVVSRDQLSVSLKPKDWVSIVSALIRGDRPSLKRVPQPVTHSRTKTEVDYMSSEKGDGAVSLRPVHYSTTFTAGQVISVQMSTQSVRGMLKPCVDLLWVARHSGICLQHTKDPVHTLTRSADSSTRGQEFHSHEEYLRAWMPLVEMEAAAGAGYSDAAVTIHNVKVAMNTQETGSFSLNAQFCADRCISIGGNSADSIPQENPRNKSAFPLDYVCLRYATPCPSQVKDLVRQADLPEALDTHFTWLAHAGVMSVLKKGKKAVDGHHLDVTLALCPNYPTPPAQLMTKEGGDVTVEILPKSVVDRRAQELLLLLEDEGCEVARALAYGDAMPELGEERKRLGEEMRHRDIGVFAKDVRPLPRNNSRQQEAVSMALTNTLTLIQGPPGTGKTYTGIKLIYLFTLINRKLAATQGQGSKAVLFCGPSNKSVDLVANLLREKLGGDCVKMVRVYGSAQEMKELAVPQGELRLRQGTQDLQCDQQLNDVALHNLIREDGKEHAQELAQFEKLFARSSSSGSSSSSSSGSQGRGGEVSHDLMKQYRRLVFEASVDELRQYEVIFTTCAVAGSHRMMEGMKGRVFQVIIDECAMCPEPLSLIPVVGSRAQQVVLIGDHQQLRPILACSAAADLGLDRSLFERLFHQFRHHAVLLDLQYRMHPQLCRFPSNQFYDGQLKTSLPKPTSWTKDLLPFWPDNQNFDQYPVPHEAYRKSPHIFVDVRGEEEKKSVPDEEGNENSRSNTEEVKKVMEILRFLKQHLNDRLANVRILTQYKAQCHKLLSSIQAECEDRSQKVFKRYDKEHISVSTVVSSQGGEWEYVILSTVCSLPSYKVERQCTPGWRRQNLGFITDSHQVNVALTRPRLGLFIVGKIPSGSGLALRGTTYCGKLRTARSGGSCLQNLQWCLRLQNRQQCCNVLAMDEELTDRRLSLGLNSLLGASVGCFCTVRRKSAVTTIPLSRKCSYACVCVT